MQADICDWLAQHCRADKIYRMRQGQEGGYLLECYGQLVYGNTAPDKNNIGVMTRVW